MVEDGCKDFSNVTVIPSGKIFGSSMIFLEYFNREEKLILLLYHTIENKKIIYLYMVLGLLKYLDLLIEMVNLLVQKL